VTAANIEGVAGFKDFADQARKKTGLPVTIVAKVADKITNLENKSHYFENGHVHLSRRVPKKLRDLLVYQLTTNHPTHDDLRDAVLLALADRPRQRWRPVR
jgi:phage terminase large subunit-like protein